MKFLVVEIKKKLYVLLKREQKDLLVFAHIQKTAFCQVDHLSYVI